MQYTKIKLFAAIVCLISSAQVIALEPGNPAPNCPLKAFHGDSPLDLSKYKGKVVYIDFWASWCGPCAQSLPFLTELQTQLKNKGLEVVAVNLDENRQDADAFLAQHPVAVTVAADPEGVCPHTYDVQAMPSSFLIDRKGKVRHVHLGFRPGDRTELRNQITALLAE